MAKAKKMGRPKSSERADVTIKFDRIQATKARHVADSQGISLAAYLDGLTHAAIDRDYVKLLRELDESASS